MTEAEGKGPCMSGQQNNEDANTELAFLHQMCNKRCNYCFVLRVIYDHQ